MKFLIRLLVFLAIAVLPIKLFAVPFSDLTSSANSPQNTSELRAQIAAEPILQALRTPLTPEEVKVQYGVDVFAEFPVVIIINKASTGPSAQTLTVYSNGQQVGRFATSTGREKWETAPSGKRYFTNTPEGWFRPQRFIRDHFSTTWEADMEFSIFYNGGIAIHATTPDHYADLGKKASGGCVRLTRENAETVWNLTVNLPQKAVPVFNMEGRLRTDANGQVVRKLGSGVLILVLNAPERP